MKLTCVTATFNCIKAGNRERLIRCVESVAKLKTAHEHLIYDGASTDGTVKLLCELAAKMPGLKIVSEPDTGIYSALNKGVRDAKGEWFYVLGSDDYLCSPKTLDIVIDELTDEDEALISSVRRETKDGEEIWFSSDSKMDSIFTCACVCHQGELIRTSLARQLGGFDEQYTIAADTDMFFKAHFQHFHFKYVYSIFACFGYGGLAISNKEEALRENRVCVANTLHLTGRSRELLVNKRFLAYGECFKLINHADMAIRLSARAMIWYRIKMILRILFYPIVVATRPIRYKPHH